MIAFDAEKMIEAVAEAIYTIDGDEWSGAGEKAAEASRRAARAALYALAEVLQDV